MRSSNKLVDFLKLAEGLRLTAYKPMGEKDTGANWTIGYGHFGAKKGDKITPAQAESILKQDIIQVEQRLAKIKLPKLTQGQWEALVSFCFNLGVARFAQSPLCRLIQNNGTVEQVQARLSKYVYSGKNKLPGLVKRRQWEAQQWAT